MSKKTELTREEIVTQYLELRTALTPAASREVMTLTYYKVRDEALAAGMNYAETLIEMIAGVEWPKPTTSTEVRKKMFADHAFASKFLGVDPSELHQMREDGAIFAFRDGASWKYKITRLCALRVSMASDGWQRQLDLEMDAAMGDSTP